MYLENFEIWFWRRKEKIQWSEKVSNEVLWRIGEYRTLLNNILHRKVNWIGHILRRNLSPSWYHWRIDGGSERCRKKKNTAPRWFEKQMKILGAKGVSWRSKKMETTVCYSNISIFHNSLDLLISSILNNNRMKRSFYLGPAFAWIWNRWHSNIYDFKLWFGSQ